MTFSVKSEIGGRHLDDLVNTNAHNMRTSNKKRSSITSYGWEIRAKCTYYHNKT